jgi:hypothetical protein
MLQKDIAKHMTTIIHRSINEPERAHLNWNATWQGPDRGLIKSWETGRKLAIQKPELAESCKAGELAPLNWKGGVARALKKKDKIGALHYLAQWQGLRGDDLDVDLNAEVTLTCTKTGMVITFTGDITKLAVQQSDTDNEEGDSNGRPTPGVPEQPLFS